MTERLILLAIWVLVGLVICGGGCLRVIRMERVRNRRITDFTHSKRDEALAMTLAVVACVGIVLLWPIAIVWAYQDWKARREGSHPKRQ